MQNEEPSRKYLDKFLSISKKSEEARNDSRIRELQEEVRAVKKEYKELEAEYDEYQKRSEEKIRNMEEKMVRLEVENTRMGNRVRFLEVTLRKYEQRQEQRQMEQ